ncbi:MAG: hypothetical protein M3Y56_07000 [Armatimonadota bacterium]|nr:hypothetical protein [Armatimonadota bacterium]
MTVGIPDDDWFIVYNKRFRECVHQLLAWGYQDARSSIGSDTEEDAVTGYIAEAIEDRLDDLSTPPEYRIFYSIREQNRVRSKTRAGKNRKIIDIVAIYKNLPLKREFWFEAKRLRTSSFPISQYVQAGMHRYLSGEYAAGLPEAAMVGYIQNSTFEHWVNELERCLISDATLRLKAALQKHLILDCLPDEWLSEHNRADGTKFSLFHIFLDCS